jgi:hypothetical protein
MNFTQQANIISLCDAQNEPGISVIGGPLIPLIVDMFNTFEDYEIGIHNPSDTTIMIVFKVGFYPPNGIVYNIHKVKDQFFDYDFNCPRPLKWAFKLIDSSINRTLLKKNIVLPRTLSSKIMDAVVRQHKQPSRLVDVEKQKLLQIENPMNLLNQTKLYPCPLD